ncbi:MAG TPA: cytochrome c [Phenylobacterium sp.]|jgi:mono/diheme cytochrome c family protein|nr:cytochrome c [Phenylobacterium sp.]
MRWRLTATFGPPLLALVFGLGVFLKGESVLHHRYPLPPVVALPARPAAEGAHLAAIYGCTDCHGDDLRGRPFPHPDPFRVVTSANLTQKAKTYSDADFARVIREGLTPQGYSVEFMPSNAFVHMTDAEVAAIVSYVRSLPAGGPDTVEWRPGWKGYWQLANGKFPPGQAFMADARRQAPRDMGAATAEGRHLTAVACSECHGGDLTGQKGGPPDLMVAGAYDPGDFHRLLKTGVAAGGRQVGMMSAAAKKRFSQLTDDEVEAIRLYLVARANAPAAK